MTAKLTTAEFWDRIEVGQPDDCWPWKLFKSPGGYGLTTGGLAHRRAWRLHHKKDIPSGMIICHRCDNPPCCNPGHLFIGTALDNGRDKAQKGRSSRLGGSLNGNSKITEVDAVQILRSWVAGESTYVLAERFGLDNSTVSELTRGLIWSHVPGSPGAPTLEEMRNRHNVVAHHKLVPSQVVVIMKRLAAGDRLDDIADANGVSTQIIKLIRRGALWSQVAGADGAPTLADMQESRRRNLAIRPKRRP